jgi:hypothetical protein
MIKIYSTVFFLLFSFLTNAQLTKTQVEKLLTNDKNRSWEFKEFKKTSGNECNGNGQLYIFYITGKVQRKRCINKKREVNELTWKIIPVGTEANGEWQLELSEKIELENSNYMKKMRIDLPLGEINKKGKLMTWRVVPDCKACIAQIVTLKSSD